MVPTTGPGAGCSRVRAHARPLGGVGRMFLVCFQLASEEEMTDGETMAALLVLWWLRWGGWVGCEGSKRMLCRRF